MEPFLTREMGFWKNGLSAIFRADTKNSRMPPQTAVWIPTAFYASLECSAHRAELMRFKPNLLNHFCQRQKKKTRLSTSLCVRAIKKIFLRECLRDLNSRHYANTKLLSFCSAMFLILSIYHSISEKSGSPSLFTGNLILSIATVSLFPMLLYPYF